MSELTVTSTAPSDCCIPCDHGETQTGADTKQAAREKERQRDRETESEKATERERLTALVSTRSDAVGSLASLHRVSH